MELTKERLIIIVAVMVAIIALGLYLFLYGPLISKLRVASVECKAAETDVTQARNSIAALKTTETKKGLITEENVSLAIDELTRQGKSKGINFISITPKQIEKSKDFLCRVCPIEIELNSTYEDLGTFLGSLDELGRSLIAVRTFDIIPDKETPAKIKTKLVVNMYLSEEK